jgi:hypothetical protein
MVNITNPRNASMDVMRGARGGAPGDAAGVLKLGTLYFKGREASL